ncbi:MAG: hypothetical protein SPL49_02515 [Oribacterium sp.]|nr:hypothetical protein [Oribacterium sp.]MDY6308649.1 hypothetical protein [Oribacterium sp.]MDY6316070.1 hypothetical protein [Oribacterium sp.]
MGQETENPIEFLKAAEEAVSAYSELKKSLEEERDREKNAGQALEKEKKRVQEKIEKTIKTRQDEVTSTYDAEIGKIDTRLKKATQEREKARKEGVKGRIRTETEPFLVENKELRRQIKAVMKQNNVSSFCTTDVFYTFFKPSGFKEILTLILVFAIIFALLPYIIYMLIPQHKEFMLFIIYLVDIFIFGGLYVLINNRTVGKHGETIRQGRDIKNRIRANKRKVKKIKRSVHRDPGEEHYNLESFDDEIAKIRQERNDVIAKKQAAENTFETVTKNIITDEIESGARETIEALSKDFSDSTEKRKALESEEQAKALELSKTYEQYIGKAHMNETDIERIREMLTAGTATSVIDAVSKIDHPETGEAETKGRD